VFGVQDQRDIERGGGCCCFRIPDPQCNCLP
jgi:hypothetical protein